MGNRFGQFNGAIDRCHRPRFDLDSTLLFAVGTVHPAEIFQGDLAGSFFLDGAAESLAQCVSGQFDLVEVWDAVALLKGLDLHRNLGGLFEVVLKFFFELRFSRVHAIISIWLPGHQHSPQFNRRTWKTPIELFCHFWAIAKADMHPG